MSQASQLFRPFAAEAESFVIDPELAVASGLTSWAAGFQLGTAGYRDLLDPDDLFNNDVPFNALNVAVLLEARAQLARQAGVRTLHVGGEVRPHTQEFIDLAARLYAAHGIGVRLRPFGERTTPIWLSSFGVFYEELDGGENFTASHSQSYKGGWKPMEAGGGQLLGMAGKIADRVRELAAIAAESGLEIRLSAADDPLIQRDFDPVAPYVDVLRQVVPAPLLAEIPTAAEQGFRAAYCVEGGSMGPTATRVFDALKIPVGPGQTVFFTHEEESNTYHGIGIVDGVNHGVDPGKWQVYKNVGAQELLLRKDCDVFFIWDPDGDRFNMVTTAPVAVAEAARDAGLEVDPLDADRCLVFFKPNQIYYLLTALKIASLEAAGELGDYDWIVATTYPTSASIGEIATAFNCQGSGSLATFRVPVGFKYFAALVEDLERQLADPSVTAAGASDVTGVETEFGPRPRFLIMAEESGGAAMGSAEPVTSRRGNRISLAPKEKDAMQIGVMSLCLAARLYREGSSFAEYYLRLLEEYDTRYRFYERQDITLFDEALQGDERESAKAAGNRLKEATVAFFASLEGVDPSEAAKILGGLLPESTTLPEIHRVFHAGDGTFIEFEEQWFELRASGTDAVLRFYMEGMDKEQVAALNSAFANMKIPMD
jgi:phosphomannomutase